VNYRHAFHAGNFADAMKHVALVAVLARLREKDKPFAVIDTHAGRGIYDLGGADARRTSEAASGIGRLRDLSAPSGALGRYLELAHDPARYPGSPLIAAALLRPQDRLVAIEKHPEEFAALKSALSLFPNARAVMADGYERLQALLPPPERRGLVLIDPAFEDEDEFAAMGRAFAAAYRRFATGIYLLWFPLKRRAEMDALAGDVVSAGATKLLGIVLDVGRSRGAPPERLAAAGLLVVNPPFGFDAEMRAALDAVLPRLCQGPGAAAAVDWLAGEA